MSSILEAQEAFNRRFLEVRKRRPKRSEVTNYFRKSGVDIESLAFGKIPEGQFKKYQSLDQDFVPVQTQDDYFAAPQAGPAAQPVVDDLPPGSETITVGQTLPDPRQQSPFPAAVQSLREQFPDLEPVEQLTADPETLLAQIPGIEPAVVDLASRTPDGIELLKMLQSLRQLGQHQQREAITEGARKRKEATDWFRRRSRATSPAPEGLQHANKESVRLRRQLDGARLKYNKMALDTPGLTTLSQMKDEAGSVRDFLYDFADTNPDYRKAMEDARRSAKFRSYPEDSRKAQNNPGLGLLHNLLAAQSRYDVADLRKRELVSKWENVPLDEELPDEIEAQKQLKFIQDNLTAKEVKFQEIYEFAKSEMPEGIGESMGAGAPVENTQKLAERMSGELWSEIKDLRKREAEGMRHVENFALFGTAEPNDMIPYNASGMLGEWGGTALGTSASLGSFAAELVAFAPVALSAELLNVVPGVDSTSYYEEPAYDQDGNPIMEPKRDPETGAAVMKDGKPEMQQKTTRRVFGASSLLTEGAPENMRSDVISGMVNGWFDNVDVQEKIVGDRLGEAAVEDGAMLITGIAHLVGAFLPSPSTLLNADQRSKTYTPEELKEVLQQPGGWDAFVNKLEEGYSGNKDLMPKMMGAMVQIMASPVRSWNTQPLSTVLTILPFVRIMAKAGVSKAGIAVAELESLAVEMGAKDTKFGLSRSAIRAINGHIQRALATPEGALATNKFIQALLTRKLRTQITRNRDLQVNIDKNPILKERLKERGESGKIFENASEVIDYAAEVGLVNPLVKGAVLYGTMAAALENHHWDDLDPYVGLGLVMGVPAAMAAIKVYTPDVATAGWNRAMADIAYQTDPVMQDLAHSIKSDVTQAGAEVKSKMNRLDTERQRAMNNGEMLYDPNQMPYQPSVIYQIKANALAKIDNAKADPTSRLAVADENLATVKRAVAERTETWDHLPGESMPVEIAGLGTFDSVPAGHGAFVADVSAARSSNRSVAHDPSGFSIFEVERPGGSLSGNRIYVHRTVSGKEALYAVNEAGQTVAFMDYTVNPLVRLGDEFSGLDPLADIPDLARLGKTAFDLTRVDQPNLEVTGFGIAAEGANGLRHTMLRHLQSRAGSIDGLAFSGNATGLGTGLKKAAAGGAGAVPYIPGEYVSAHQVHPFLVERAIAQGKAVPTEVLKAYQQQLNIADGSIEKALPQFERFPEVQRANREVLLEENLIWHDSFQKQGSMHRENAVSRGLERFDNTRLRLERQQETRLKDIEDKYQQSVEEAKTVAEERIPTEADVLRSNAVLERATKAHTAQVEALKALRKETRETYVKDQTLLRGNKRNTEIASTKEVGALIERRQTIESALANDKVVNKRWRKSSVTSFIEQIATLEDSIAVVEKSFRSKRGSITKKRNLYKKGNRKKGITAKQQKEMLAELELERAEQVQPLLDNLNNAKGKQERFTTERRKDATQTESYNNTIKGKRDELGNLGRSFADQQLSLKQTLDDAVADIDARIEKANTVLQEAGNKASKKDSQILQQLEAQRDASVKKAAARHQRDIGAIAKLQDHQLRVIAKLTDEYRSNLFGELADAPVLTEYADKPVIFDPKLGVFGDGVFKDSPSGLKKVPHSLPDGTPPPVALDLGKRLGALIDRVRAAPEAGLSEAYKLIIDITDRMVEAEGGLNYSTGQLKRISKEIGIDLTAKGLGSELAAALVGGRGGLNKMRRIYAETLMAFITDNAHARLLGSEAARSNFRSWMMNEKGFNLPGKMFGKRSLKDKVVDAVTLSRGLDKLILDYSQGRSNGGAIFKIQDPVIVVGKKAYRLSEAFEQWAITEADGVVLTDAVSSSLNTMSHMMARNLESRMSAKVLAKEMDGVKGWADDGYTVDYAEGMYLYLLENGRVPPVLKGIPSNWDLWIADPVRAKAVAERIGAEGLSRLKTETGSYNGGTTALGDTIPSMSDIGAAQAAVYERGTGLSRGKLPVMVDNVASFAESMGINQSTFLDNGLKATLGWLHETNQLLKYDAGFMTSLSQYIKLNLTALRPATAVNNFMSNYYNKLTHDGIDPITGMLQIQQTIKLGQKAKWAPETLEAAVLDDFHNLKDYTGFDWSTFIDGEVAGAVSQGIKNAGDPTGWGAAMDFVQNLTHQGRLGSMDLPLGAGSAVRAITRTAIELYRQGDIIFKVDTSMREMARSRAALSKLSVGRRVTLRDVNTGVLQGRVFKLKSGKFEFVDRRGKRTVVDSMSDPLIAKARAQSAMGKANARFVDFADAQGLLKVIKKMDFVVGGPFRTWIWKTTDIPGVKKGIVYHTFFDDLPMLTNDPIIFNELMLDAMGSQARRSLLINIYDHVEADDKFKRRMIPQYQAMGADFIGDKSYTTVAQKNFAAGLFTIIQAMEVGATPEGEAKFDKAMRRQKGAAELVLKDLFMTEGLFPQMVTSLVKGVTKTGGELVTYGDYANNVGNMLLPGYQAQGIDASITYMNPLNEFSGYSLDRRMDPQQHMRTDAYLLKNMVGYKLSQFDPKTQLKGWKSAIGKVEGERVKRLGDINANLDLSSEQRIDETKKVEDYFDIIIGDFTKAWRETEAYVGERE